MALGLDVALDPELFSTKSRAGFVQPSDANFNLTGHHGLVALPVWLQGTRLTQAVSAARPGIAALFDWHTDSADPEATESEYAPTRPAVEFDGFGSVTRYPRTKILPRFIRVLDALTGAIVFTSQMPDSLLAPARSAPMPNADLKIIQCPDGYARRQGFLAIFGQDTIAPTGDYFLDRLPPVRDAVRFRNLLLEKPHMEALFGAINAHFVTWFWRVVADLPEVPSFQTLCTNPEFWRSDRFKQSAPELDEPTAPARGCAASRQTGGRS